ncbi:MULTISPECIES: ABC transporter ATP-binding protein [Exiguobacterium]|uniref:ABC transporter ATP-binding protein n=1 Tax=Exiguobacterium TaxID=33986 RepID=UPI001BE715CE|nr:MULTISPECIES: ABC transporter ATP-binding protein [Exiguobacterium]MCT4778267.1 ABC transporter ATP-binding protein [Exiguobacterium aquaticum]MCT4790203.1 ABC transporter ATP-binding protein [Exiguobacterium mexicanum]
MKLTNICHTYDGQPILRGIDLQVEPGECIGIIGPSGSGKSTLLQILGLLKRPDVGHIELEGRKLLAASEEERRLLRLNEIGFVFQQAHLVPYLTVREQLELVQAESESKQDPLRLLDVLGLSHRLNQLPKHLSGGERQRVAVARALINRPRLLLADEPTASLDFENGRRVMELLVAEARHHGRRVVVITHDERMLDVCDRVLLLQDGKLQPSPRH